MSRRIICEPDPNAVPVVNGQLTDLTVVIDRSGSMASCKADAENGMNRFIRQQQELPGECVFSLVQFDTEYEAVHLAKSIREITPDYVLIPRNGTALLDSLGRAITETGVRLRDMPESNRPGLVVFVVITDGQENASKEFTRAKIKEMIEHQTNVYKWQFTFLGSNQDSFTEAGWMGFSQASIADYAGEKTSDGILLASASVCRMRSQSFTGQAVRNAYTDEERESVK